MSSKKKSLSRRLSIAALLAALTTGGLLSSGINGTVSAGDGPPRCCFKTK